MMIRSWIRKSPARFVLERQKSPLRTSQAQVIRHRRVSEVMGVWVVWGCGRSSPRTYGFTTLTVSISSCIASRPRSVISRSLSLKFEMLCVRCRSGKKVYPCLPFIMTISFPIPSCLVLTNTLFLEILPMLGISSLQLNRCIDDHDLHHQHDSHYGSATVLVGHWASIPGHMLSLISSRSS